MKILIADDEDYTREGLVENISWDDIGIDEIMQAVNGQEALKIARWFQPDIVLTDIRMPKMDGIDFAAELTELCPDSKIIFMSGYMEIDYLKSAIRLSAVDYIEKPIDLLLLKMALEKARKEIIEKKKSFSVTEAHKEVQEQKLLGLLSGKDADMKTVKKLAGELEFPLYLEYLCLMIQFPKKGRTQSHKLEEIQNLLNKPTHKVIGSYVKEKSRFEFLIAFDEKEHYRLQPLYQKLLDVLPEAQLGIGMEVKDSKYIYNSYRTAQAAINCAFYQTNQRMFRIDADIMQKKFIDPGIYGEFVQILSEQPASLPEWFGKLFMELYHHKYYQKEQVYMLLSSLLTAIYKQYPEAFDGFPEITEEEQLHSFIQQMDTLSEIQEFFDRLMEVLKERKEEQSAYSRVIRGVLEYISRHYGEEELSIVQIAEHLHFSSAYLNVLFKQEMKVTLKQYLSNYRVEKARKMLENNYDKITEVAEKCGYANANYFAKVFREAVGMTPAEYRKERSK